MSVWLTVPTRGDHPDLLEAFVATSGLPRERVVVVRTADCDVPDGVVVVDDRGPVNVHRWWNVGLDVAEDGGAEFVAVLNDDVRIRSTSLILLAGALAVTDAVLAWSAPSGITGWAYMVRPDAIRPDERFRWWFGDNDLAMQAGEAYVGIDARIHHLAGNATTSADPELQRLAALDEPKFKQKWGLPQEVSA